MLRTEGFWVSSVMVFSKKKNPLWCEPGGPYGDGVSSGGDDWDRKRFGLSASRWRRYFQQAEDIFAILRQVTFDVDRDKAREELDSSGEYGKRVRVSVVA